MKNNTNYYIVWNSGAITHHETLQEALGTKAFGVIYDARTNSMLYTRGVEQAWQSIPDGLYYDSTASGYRLPGGKKPYRSSGMNEDGKWVMEDGDPLS